MADITLIHGDCLEVMKTLPDHSIDMILCDLPYGTTNCAWDSVIPFEPLWAQYERLIKPNGAIVLTASQPFTTALIASRIKLFKYCWVWEKSIAGDAMNAKNKPMKKHEDICVFSKGTTANKSERRMTYYPQGLARRSIPRQRSGTDYGKTGGSFKVPRPSHGAYEQEWEGYPTSLLYFKKDSETLHPTQKPVALFEYLIRTYTNPGDTVLDNCVGSGTTGVAAMQCGRKAILIEKDAHYYEVARTRLDGIQPLLLTGTDDG